MSTECCCSVDVPGGVADDGGPSSYESMSSSLSSSSSSISSSSKGEMSTSSSADEERSSWSTTGAATGSDNLAGETVSNDGEKKEKDVLWVVGAVWDVVEDFVEVGHGGG